MFAKPLKHILKPALILLLALLLVSCGSNATQNASQLDSPGDVASNEAAGPAAPGQAATSETTQVPVNVSILTLTSPASPGSSVTLFAKTATGWVCEIKVGYKAGTSETQALVPKQVEENGLVSWTWTIDSAVPYGVYPVTVTAKAPDGSSSVTAQKNIEIKSAEECKK